MTQSLGKGLGGMNGSASKTQSEKPNFLITNDYLEKSIRTKLWLGGKWVTIKETANCYKNRVPYVVMKNPKPTTPITANPLMSNGSVSDTTEKSTDNSSVRIPF